MSASTRWLVLVGVVAAALVVLSAVVALVADREVELDPTTPEGTVQSYLRAVVDRDVDAVLDFYAADLRDRCEESGQVRDSLRYGPDDFSAAIEEVAERESGTEVIVAITQSYGSGPFDRGESTFTQAFILVETPEGWRFTEAPWPTWCPSPMPTATAVPAPGA